MQRLATEGDGTLLERDVVLEALRRGAAVRRGEPARALLLTGAAGMGKTSVVRALAATFDDGVRVLPARGRPGVAAWPFGVAAEALGPAVAADPALLSGPAAVAAPLLGAGPADADAVRAPVPSAAETAHGLRVVLARLAATGPVVLVLDDAHWADAPSLERLAAAARDGEPPGLAVVAATRPVEGDGPLGALRDAARIVRLEPLSAEATRRAVALGAGRDLAPDEAQEAHRVTGGVPFLAAELAMHLRESGAPPIAEAAVLDASAADRIRRRVMAGPPAAGDPGRAVAILGDHATLHRVARMTGAAPAPLAAELDRLTQVGVLGPGPRLAHPLVRDALLASLGPHERGLLHDRAAAVLAADGADPATTSAHLLLAPPAGRPASVAVLVRAAREARAAGGAAHAAALLERALREPPAVDERGTVRIAAAHALADAGDVPAAERLLADALRDAHGDARATIAAWSATVEVRLQAGLLTGAGDAARSLLRLVREVEPELDPRSIRDARALAAEALSFTVDPDESPVDASAVVRPPIPATTAARRMLATVALIGALAMSVSVPRVRELVRWAEDDGGLAEDPEAGAAVVSMATGAHFLVGDYAAGIALATAAMESAPDAEVATLRYLRSAARLAAGDLPGAEDDALAAASGHHPASAWATGGRIQAALVRLLHDEPADALALLDDAAPDPRIPTIARDQHLVARAQVLLALDRPADALDALRPLREGTPAGPAHPGHGLLDPIATAAEALLRSGDRDGALAALLPDAERVRAWAAPVATAHRIGTLGLVRGGPEGVALLRSVVGDAQVGAHVAVRALVLLRLGGALRRAGDRREARERLADARVLAERHGLRRLARLAREELVLAGGRSGRARGPGRLTAAELRVAERVAAGATTRQAAAALYVTPKTVEYHLRNAYRKLGVVDRVGLPGALERARDETGADA